MTFLDVWRRVRAICDYISSLYAIRPDRTVSPPGPPAHYPQSPPAPQAAPQPPTALSFPSLGFGCSFLSRFLRVKMVKLQLKMVKLRLKIVENVTTCTPDSRRVGFPPLLLSGAPGLKYGSILEFGPMQDIAVWLKTEMSGGRPKGVLSSALALPSG